MVGPWRPIWLVSNRSEAWQSSLWAQGPFQQNPKRSGNTVAGSEAKSWAPCLFLLRQNLASLIQGHPAIRSCQQCKHFAA